MTKQQFLDQFFLNYDEVNTFGAPGYDIPRISILASEVQEQIIINKYNPKSNSSQEGLEETEKRIQDLGELIKYQTFSTPFTTGYFENSIIVTLPNTLITSGPTNYTDVFWIPIYESVITDTKTCDGSKFIRANVITAKHTPLDIILQDPFNKPYLLYDKAKVLRVRSENRVHTLITDGTFNITDYQLGYIKKPTPIDFSVNLTTQVSQLSDSMQRELLNETVIYALKIARESQQYLIETQKTNQDKN